MCEEAFRVKFVQSFHLWVINDLLIDFSIFHAHLLSEFAIHAILDFEALSWQSRFTNFWDFE